MTKKKDPKDHLKVGRPSTVTPEVLAKLEKAYAIGCTDIQACAYAGISTWALTRYQRKNPEFRQRKLELKENPILKAKQTIFNNLDDPKVAQWYLEKRSPEFKDKIEIEHNIKLERLIDRLTNNGNTREIAEGDRFSTTSDATGSNIIEGEIQDS